MIMIKRTHETHGHLQLTSQDLQHFFDPFLTKRTQSVQRGPADPDPFRSESDGLEHIRASAHPSVDKDLFMLTHTKYIYIHIYNLSMGAYTYRFAYIHVERARERTKERFYEYIEGVGMKFGVFLESSHDFG